MGLLEPVVAVVLEPMVVIDPVVLELPGVLDVVELLMKVRFGIKSLASLEASTFPKPVTKSHPLPLQ